jgi:predicted kinase
MRNSRFEDAQDPKNMHNYPVIYGAIDYAIGQILEAWYSAIYDANVNHKKEREKNAKIAAIYGADAITIWVKLPVELAVQRAASRKATSEQFKILAGSSYKYELCPIVFKQTKIVTLI